jgi:hypothetical protein
VQVTLVRTDQRAFLHVFDAPGSFYRGDRPDVPLQHLGTSTTHLFVLDPLTIPAVREFVEPEAGGHPVDSILVVEEAYHAMVTWIARCGLEVSRCRLAFVVTRADVLAARGVSFPDGSPAAVSGSLRSWLAGMGTENLVQMAEMDFRQVRFFLTGVGRDALPPFRWLLRGPAALGAR